MRNKCKEPKVDASITDTNDNDNNVCFCLRGVVADFYYLLYVILVLGFGGKHKQTLKRMRFFVFGYFLECGNRYNSQNSKVRVTHSIF